MKTIKLLILMLLTISMNSQIASLEARLDPTLALFKDDHGNTPFTLDLAIDFTLYDHDNNQYMAIMVEYADLAGGEYFRASGEYGYLLDLIQLEPFEFSTGLNIGIISRWGIGSLSFGNTSKAKYEYYEGWSVILTSQIINRTDIYDLNIKDMQFNGYIGIQKAF